MTISTKGRYGLLFMLDVLENQEAEAVRLKDVAKRHLCQWHPLGQN